MDENISFENLLSEQFNYAILAFIYIPFLYVIIILEPWNFDFLNEFLEGKIAIQKIQNFVNYA